MTLLPHRGFIAAQIAETSDITLAVLCRRLFDMHGVRSDTGTISRLRREGLTLKKDARRL